MNFHIFYPCFVNTILLTLDILMRGDCILIKYSYTIFLDYISETLKITEVTLYFK